MTIPQILSAVGSTVFSIAALFMLLHTVNILMPGFDYFIRSSHLGAGPYYIAMPAAIIGLVVAIIGRYGERLEAWWLERQRED
jgi:hypothetical protein